MNRKLLTEMTPYEIIDKCLDDNPMSFRLIPTSIFGVNPSHSMRETGSLHIAYIHTKESKRALDDALSKHCIREDQSRSQMRRVQVNGIEVVGRSRAELGRAIIKKKAEHAVSVMNSPTYDDIGEPVQSIIAEIIRRPNTFIVRQEAQMFRDDYCDKTVIEDKHTRVKFVIKHTHEVKLISHTFFTEREERVLIDALFQVLNFTAAKRAERKQAQKEMKLAQQRASLMNAYSEK